MTTKVDVRTCGTSLAELVALAQAGNEVIVLDGDQPVARVVPVAPPQQKRLFGLFRGKIRIADDFDAPLPDEFWLGEQ